MQMNIHDVKRVILQHKVLFVRDGTNTRRVPTLDLTIEYGEGEKADSLVLVTFGEDEGSPICVETK
jgi:hypothetical protein